MKIGFTFDLIRKPDIKSGETDDMFAEFDDIITIEEIETALTAAGHNVTRIGDGLDLINKIDKVKSNFDLIFNICEGVYGRNREGQVPTILEMFNIPYTGSDSLALGINLDKILTKKILIYHGINTPKFYETANENDSFNNFNLSFPVIIKPSREGTSKGISQESIAHNTKYLKERTKWLINKYKQPALIEEFIFGKEFTVLVLGNKNPIAFPPVQISIKNNTELGFDFYTHDRVENTDLTYICPSKEPEYLLEELMKISVEAFKILELRDFARFDFRVDKNNKSVFLECNPLPNLGKIDIIPITAKVVGKTYNDLISMIVELAKERYGL